MLLESFSPLPLRLLPDAAVLTMEEKPCLVVADLHLGKSAAFRALGLPVPEGDTSRDLGRLAAIIGEHRPARLVVAGDLFHADAGSSDGPLEAFAGFLDTTRIPFTLVAGNHDRKVRKLPGEWEKVESLDLGGLRIVHRPEDAEHGIPHLCGHVHPVLRIPDGRKTSLRMPCFHLRQHILTLPAFGSFTGGHIVKPENGDRFFVNHLGEVIEIPQRLIG